MGSPGSISFIPAGSVYIRVSYVYLHLVDIYIYFMVNVGTYIIHGSLWDFTSTVTINFAQVLRGHQQLFQIPSVSDGFGFILFGNRTCHHACVIPGTIPDKRPRLTVASKFVDGDQVILGINSIVQCSWIGMDCEAKPFGPPRSSAIFHPARAT